MIRWRDIQDAVKPAFRYFCDFTPKTSDERYSLTVEYESFLKRYLRAQSKFCCNGWVAVNLTKVPKFQLPVQSPYGQELMADILGTIGHSIAKLLALVRNRSDWLIEEESRWLRFGGVFGAWITRQQIKLDTWFFYYFWVISLVE
jgi:hypothetical protein